MIQIILPGASGSLPPGTKAKRASDPSLSPDFLYLNIHMLLAKKEGIGFFSAIGRHAGEPIRAKPYRSPILSMGSVRCSLPLFTCSQ
jgi:hypothetical protein